MPRSCLPYISPSIGPYDGLGQNLFPILKVAIHPARKQLWILVVELQFLQQLFWRTESFCICEWFTNVNGNCNRRKWMKVCLIWNDIPGRLGSWIAWMVCPTGFPFVLLGITMHVSELLVAYWRRNHTRERLLQSHNIQIPSYVRESSSSESYRLQQHQMQNPTTNAPLRLIPIPKDLMLQ